MASKDPVEFRLYDTDLTSVLGILPAKSMNLFLLLNEPGSGEVSIPLNSRANSQIASDMFVETKYRGGVRGGFFVENIGRDFAKTNEVEDQVVSISGRGALALLDDAIVWDDGTGASTRTFTGTRAGILIELIEEAKVRGALLNLDYDFSATHDSDSEGWTDADDEPLILNVGTSYLEIVRRMAKVGTDFTMTPDGTGNYVLSAYKDGVGDDKSESVYFRMGVNCTEVSSLEAGGEIKNVLKVKYNGGFAKVEDSASISLRRRREGLYDASYTARPDTAITFGSAELELRKDPKKQITLKVYDGAGPRVFVDYGLGDRVTLDIEGVEVTYRVRGLQLTWNGEKFSDVTVDLNSIILENEIKMSQDIAWLMEQWRSAHDANLLEVQYWANIGDPTESYSISDMLIVGSKLYVASGTYLHIYNIATGSWSKVSLGYSSLCLANVGTDIYIGCFHRLLKYDGSSVTTIGTLSNAPNVEPPFVQAITAIGTKIYFGGLYTSVDSGALSTQEIVEYDTLTDTFTDIGGLVSPLDLINDGANLYACNASGVEMWNTSSWSALGSLTNVTCLALYGNNLLAGGSFTGKISEWDGATWTVLGGGVDGNVLAIATYLADIYVGGFITGGIKRYSGGLWWDLDGGTNDRVTDIIVSNGTVYVGGPFTQAGDKTVNEIAVYFNNFESLADYLESSKGTFDLAGAMHGAIAKTSVVSNDEFGFWDSVSTQLRKITWANILLSIKTYTDTLYRTLTDNIFTSLIINDTAHVNGGTGDIEMTAPDNENPAVIMHAYNGTPAILPFVAEGTKASPTAVSANKLLSLLAPKAYDGSAYSNVGRIRLIATQNHTGSAKGTKWQMYVVKDGESTETLIGSITKDGINLESGYQFWINGAQHTHDAGNIKSGTMDWDRLPTPKVDENDEATLRQRMDGDLTYLEHFDGSSMPARFTWAGSPFVTPTTINHSTNSQLIISNTGTWRAFLYDTALPTNNSYLQSVIRYVAGVTNYGFVGLRYDDGSDSNYIELGLYNYGSGYHVCKIYKRSGGGAVTETTDTVNHYLPQMFVIGTSQWGTEWTNWGCNLNLGLTNQGAKVLLAYRIGVASLTWTPSRFGIAFRGNAEVISLIEAYTKD